MALQLMLDEAAPPSRPGGHGPVGLCQGPDRAFRQSRAQPPLDPDRDGRLAKIPQRWLATLAANQAEGRSCPAILSAIAAWIKHLRGHNGPVDDPRAGALAEAVPWDPVTGLWCRGGLIESDWVPNGADIALIEQGLGT
jgi:fructuronate reductase